MGVIDYFKPKQQPVEDSDRAYDESGAWHYKPGSEGERRALAAREARWAKAESENKATYDIEHGRPMAQSKPQGKGKTQIQQKTLTSQQAIALAKLQLKAQQQATKEAKLQRRMLRTTPMQYQLNDSSNGFASFNHNVFVGTLRTQENLSKLTENINAYNRNIGNFDMDFGYDRIDANLKEYEQRIQRLFG